ncbi:MAG TPA: hypothetical protein VFR90_15120 [Methylibium sp.]|uniref:hypothetical protein n=1 Tax=Methylibium sp. TaxID=2067992 RepID=UPI002DB68127|nr:hypothetical protein [Methylibium sp.]HEU4460450.1 hypothetical protein [Methylibium sp.]
MGDWISPTSLALALLLAFGLERLALRGLRAAALAFEPVSGEHTDSVVYHRDLLALTERDMQTVFGLLLAAAVSGAVAWHAPGWPAWPSLVAWLGALGWDLWTWERAAGSVKFVSWKRGWRQSARRVAVSDLAEVNVVVRRGASAKGIGRALPPTCYLALLMADGKAVKLPRTGAWPFGERRVEDFANFVRMQIAVVADLRRRAEAEKRSAARHAAVEQEPVHPAQKIDPLAINRGKY